MGKRHWLAIGAMVAAFACASSSYAQNPCRLNHNKIMSELRSPHDDLTLLVAHRGVHVVLGSDAYYNVPENSLESITAAANECIEAIEVDVRQTQDGVAILTHDANWGRETNVGAKFGGNNELYNPFIGSGPNPAVSSWSRSSVQDGDTRLILRNSVNFRWSSPAWGTPESPPTLAQAIQFMKNNNIEAVLAVDAKDGNGMAAAINDILAAGYSQQAFIKAPGSWFPDPSDLYNYLQRVSPNNAPINIKVMTVYNTADIQPNNFFGAPGGEDKVWNSVWKYSQTLAPYWLGYEVNLKQNNGILQATQNMYQSQAGTRARGIFNPWNEFVGSRGEYLYYNSDGRCCSQLTAYLFNGAPYGLPSDTEDNRPDWNFIVNQQSFTVITTDNVLSIRGFLESRRRRAGFYRLQN